ncbi:TfuA-like protein [Devosia sp.]|uniref:TfuA-like protein n=1 Tax=Devosia sp. TaxID=1871048 RepID=UPI0032673DAA
MKLLFAGPSIFGARLNLGDVLLRPPAVHGDISLAIARGAKAIGLVDGSFGWVASVWHKEILFALQGGVNIYGGASMGALRAAECAHFGMVPVGKIAHWYLDGTLDDDGDVAVVQCPPELDFQPLTEAVVDTLATVSELDRLGLISPNECIALQTATRLVHFRDRTVATLIEQALPATRHDAVAAAYHQHRVGLKTADALEVLEAVKASRNSRRTPTQWQFAQSSFWEQALDDLVLRNR